MNVNRVVLTGNLTRDPEAVGEASARFRMASNGRKKDGDDWVDAPLFINVFVPRGKAVLDYLERGRCVAVDGRLDMHEWTGDDDVKRSEISIVADNVEFIGGRDGGGDAAGDSQKSDSSAGSESGNDIGW